MRRLRRDAFGGPRQVRRDLHAHRRAGARVQRQAREEPAAAAQVRDLRLGVLGGGGEGEGGVGEMFSCWRGGNEIQFFFFLFFFFFIF